MPTKKELAGLKNETPQQPLRRGRGLRLSRASKHASQEASKPSESPEPAALAPRRPSQPAAEAAPRARPNAAEAAEAKAAEVAPSAPVAVSASSQHVVAAPSAPAGEPSTAAAPPDLDTLKPERKQRKLLLRKDLLKQCKRIARAQDRKLYQVVESALEEYIQRYGAHE